MEFRILGPLAVLAGDRDVTPSRPKQRVLLAALLLRSGEPVPSERLIDTLWGDRPPETALTALHGHVSALRKLLGAAVIETRPPGYRLRAPPEGIDLARFEALTAEARAEPDPTRRGDLLRTGLSLFRGPPLADLRHFDAFRADVARIEELRLLALEGRIDADLVLGRHAELVPELEQLAGDQPLRERLRGQLMLALYRSGRQADALGVYRDAVRILATELGLEPGPALRSLERAILAGEPSLAAPAPPAPTALRRRERKLVSVLACHLHEPFGGEGIDPEDAEAVLECRLAIVREELDRFGGTLESVAGGAVLAAFGATRTHEDDAERAVRTALALRERLGVRIAVVTGEALVIPGARAGEQSIGGDIAGSAWRMCDGAPGGAVVAGDRTRRATEHAIDYARDDTVLGARRSAERRRPSAALAGRRRELDLLAHTLLRARADRAPQFVTLVGAPGIGKTRLVRELYAIAASDAAEVVWLQGRCLPYGEGVTFWALGEIVKSHAGVFEGDPPDVVARKLSIAVAEVLGRDERVLGHLRRLVGLAAGGPLAAERREDAFAAWRAFFHAIADRAPLVLAVEDLQWADDGLLDFLDDLAGTPADVPMLVLLTSRSDLLERRPQWGGGKRNAATVTLGPLSDDETCSVLAELLGHAPDDALLRRAQGNPLYAEEYARLVLAGGHAEDLPESLQALIAARLDAVPPEEKALVQDAAVVGEVAWLGAIAAAGGRSAAAVDELARSLERKDLLRRRRRSAVEGETEFAFHHVLVRDVAYGQIPRAQRSEKHRLTAGWIESLGRREDHVELLAHHYVRALELLRTAGGGAGGLEQLARLALRDAGDRAARLGGLPGAARFYRRALELWPRDDPGRGMLLLQLARVLRLTEVAGESELRAASDQLLAAGDRLHAAVALSLLLSLYQEQGRSELARETFAAVTALVAGLSPSLEKADVLSELCRSKMMSQDDAEAIRLGQEALGICERLGLDDIRVSVLISIGSARAVSDPEAAEAELEQGIALALAAGSHEAARGYGNLASMLMDRADLPASYAARRAGQAYSERWGLHWYARWLRTEELAELYYTLAAWDELLERAEPLAREPTFVAQLALGLAIRVRLARGEIDVALAAAERLAAFARAAAEPQASVAALAVAALAQQRAGRKRESHELADRALALLSPSRPRSLYLAAPVLGDLLHELGRGAELAPLAATDGEGSPWLDAGIASAAGEFALAAAVYERIGARPDEAQARLRDGADLVRMERRDEAAEQLHRAEGFFRSVHAAVPLAEIEALLARVHG